MIQAKKFIENSKYKKFVKLYGISQNPDTKDYILVQNNFIWRSGYKRIDNFIQEMQLKIDDIIFEWIPYNQFNEIKEIAKNEFIAVYSAIWKDGPLLYQKYEKEYTRNSNRNVALKCLHYTQDQNPIKFLINKVYRFIFISVLIYNINFFYLCFVID